MAASEQATGIDELDVDLWRNRPGPLDLGGPDFGRFLEAFRLLQDMVSGACPPDDEVGPLADEVAALAERFRPKQAAEPRTAANGRSPGPPTGGVVVTDAEGLFVQLRAGQP